jgi:glutamate carboxypeptidase
MVMDIKEKVLELIHGWEEEQHDFLIALCEQNSYTFHKQGSDRVNALILKKLEGIFPIHKVIDQKEFGDLHILKTREKGKAVYLLGHTDTVFPPNHPFQTCRREGEWLCGPGTADMKGGLAVMVYALKALNQVRGVELPNLTMILGGDEEAGSPASRKIYEQESTKAWICLVGECAGEKGEIVVSRNGKAGGRMETYGRDSHVGSATQDKASAILELVQKVIAFESLNGIFPGVRVNVGRIEGGLGPGTIPAQASFLFDLRWQEEEHYPLLLERIQEIASVKIHPLCSSHMTLLNYRPAMPANAKTDTFVSKLRQVAEGLGQKVFTEHRQGTSDGNFFGAEGVPTLDGFGPIGLNDHTPEERILISSLKARTSLLALFLLGLKDADLDSKSYI